MVDDISLEDPDSVRHLLDFLIHWLAYHILGTDQNMAIQVCMMIDADHFKEVNDTYGHDAGDLVLRELATALKHAVRSDDIVCRLGGDEFFIICPQTDKAGGMHFAETICQSIAALRVPTGDGAWQGSVSIGVAARSDEMDNLDELMKLADEGVYLAKKAGKNCVRAKG